MNDIDTGAIHRFAEAMPWLTGPVIVITAFFIFLGPLAVLAITWVTRRSRAAVASGAAVCVSTVVVRISDHLWYRPRPFVVGHYVPLFPHTLSSSFPSGTVSIATIAAAVVWLTWRRFGILLFIGTLVVAFGCVYVGVHYVSDVFAGALLGLVCAAGCWAGTGVPRVAALFEMIDQRLLRRQASDPS